MGGPKAADRVLVGAAAYRQCRQIGMGIEIIGLELYRTLETLGRSIQITSSTLGGPQIGIGVGVLGIPLDRSSNEINRFLMIATLVTNDTHQMQRIGLFWDQFENLLVDRGGNSDVASLMMLNTLLQ